MEKKEIYYYDSKRDRVKKRIHNLFVREPVPYYLNEPLGTKVLKVGKKTATVAAIATLSVAVLGPPVYALPNTPFSTEGADSFQSGNPAAPEAPHNPIPNIGAEEPGGDPSPNPSQPNQQLPEQPQPTKPAEQPEQKPDPVQKPNPQPTKPTEQPEQKPDKEPDSQPTKPTELPKPNTKPKSTIETPRVKSNDSVQVAKETKVYGEESKAEKSGVVKAAKTKRDKSVEETQKSESEEIRTEDGGELPDTSTNSPLFAVLSSMGVLAGTGLLFSRRKVGE